MSEKLSEFVCPKCGSILVVEVKAEEKATLSEDRFNVLKWEKEKGSRLGDFQVAYKKLNLPDKWHHAYNILKANNSLISNPLKEPGYVCRYWIYPEKYTDRIFRKKLSEKEVKS